MARECLRVEQLDATILDAEYRDAALVQIDATIEGLPVGVSRVLEKVRPELELAVDTVLWSTRITQGASVGQIEEDISYKDYDRKKVGIHFLLAVLAPYLAQRTSQLTGSLTSQRIMLKIEALWELIGLVHHVRFLRRGGYSSPLESLLLLRNWNNNLPTIGTQNYDSQNRELLWHAFRDGLLLGWPIAMIMKKEWKKRNRKENTENNDMMCVGCGRVAVIPVRRSCSHVACYWCDTSRNENNCISCGKEGNIEIVKGQKVV